MIQELVTSSSTELPTSRYIYTSTALDNPLYVDLSPPLPSPLPCPSVQLYTEYISKFDKALKHLDECMKKYSLFAEVVREFEAQPKCAHLPLASYLLEIVQRIPRYKMLLSGKYVFTCKTLVLVVYQIPLYLLKQICD